MWISASEKQTRRIERETLVLRERIRLAEMAPEDADAILGRAIGVMHGGDGAKRVELIEKLHAEGGGDDLLVEFVDSARHYGDVAELRRAMACGGGRRTGEASGGGVVCGDGGAV